jgi:hypothetical protein
LTFEYVIRNEAEMERTLTLYLQEREDEDTGSVRSIYLRIALGNDDPDWTETGRVSLSEEEVRRLVAPKSSSELHAALYARFHITDFSWPRDLPRGLFHEDAGDLREQLSAWLASDAGTPTTERKGGGAEPAAN